ncbi:hypothetical protein FQN49_003466 [Arthroderma sp. PD_2]|nr:hypothetical protein FQN49_003466 [Arthroderma sp. PD_2]
MLILFVKPRIDQFSWFSGAAAGSYTSPVEVSAVKHGYRACRVLVSKTEKAGVGDLIFAMCGWTEYAIIEEDEFEARSRFPGLQEPQDILSALSASSLRAWIGMTRIGELEGGDTVVVSTTAGATGSIAGQIAKIKGARVVGICGSDNNCKWLADELGFDVALHYIASDFREQFKSATPDYMIRLTWWNCEAAVGGPVDKNDIDS